MPCQNRNGMHVICFELYVPDGAACLMQSILLCDIILMSPWYQRHCVQRAADGGCHQKETPHIYSSSLLLHLFIYLSLHSSLSLYISASKPDYWEPVWMIIIMIFCLQMFCCLFIALFINCFVKFSWMFKHSLFLLLTTAFDSSFLFL